MKIDQYDFDIDRISAYLKPFVERLPNLYDWEAKFDTLVDLNVLTASELSELNGKQHYQKDILLKNKIGALLRLTYNTDPSLFNRLSLWVIEEWGGINGAAKHDTVAAVHHFIKNGFKDFNRISSTSKIAAFMYPSEYIIYDSRVAYALNWILLSESAGSLYFPIPEGRNSKTAAFDMNVLIRLKNMDLYMPICDDELLNRKYVNNRDKRLFIQKNKAYGILNKLVAEISKLLWSSPQSEVLFYTEMLLFSIADKFVFKDIAKRVRLSIESYPVLPVKTDKSC